MAKRIAASNLRKEKAHFETIEQLSLSGFRGGRFRVDADGGRFDCVLSRGQGRLFVLLSGGIERGSGNELPHFQRWKWAPDFPGNVLLVSDPTLYLADNLGLGWYLGNAESNWTRTLSHVVAGIAEELRVSSTRVVFYGSSAGGFAAIAAASWLPGSGAISINPQTDVLRYHPGAVRRMLEACFPGATAEDFPERDRDRLLAVAQCERSPETRVLIAQNAQDEVHRELHYSPFCEHFGMPPSGGVSPSGTKMSMLFESDRGHVGGEPRNLVPELLSSYEQLIPPGPRRRVETRILR